VVGYILGEIMERDPFYVANRFGRLHEVSVDPKYQHKGLFTMAYLDFLRFLKEKDIDLIDAEMDLENSALAAYWKLNYYKRSFKLISWVKKTEVFLHRLEKNKKKIKEMQEKGLSTEYLT